MDTNRLKLKTRRLLSLQKTQKILSDNIFCLHNKLMSNETPTMVKLDLKEDIRTCYEVQNGLHECIARVLEELKML